MKFKRILNMFAKAINRFSEHRVSVYAGQATMFIIISAIPFFMLILSVMQYIVPLSEADVLQLCEGVLPSAAMPYASRILGELYSASSISIASITGITVIWSASKGLMSLVIGLENIYSSHSVYVSARARSIVYTVVFVISLVATLFLFVISKYLIKITDIKLLTDISEAIGKFPVFIYIIILALLFAAFYKFFPRQKIKFKKQFPGAIFSAFGWVLFSKIYSFYIDNFSGYSYLYGSLTAIVLLILWLYFCMNIFLIGAELNVYLIETEGRLLVRKKN